MSENAATTPTRASPFKLTIFISWAGEGSRIAAQAMRGWLPRVLQSVQPWMSAEDIESGARWSAELEEQLVASSAGIVCVTRENLKRPWVLFEAGALASKMGRPMVCPFLVDMPAVELTGPLSILQAREANEAGTWKLVETINNRLGEARISGEQLRETFELWWPKLEPEFGEARQAGGAGAAASPRAAADILGELLELARAQEQREIDRARLRAVGRALAAAKTDSMQSDMVGELTTRRAIRGVGRMVEGVTRSSEVSEVIGGGLEMKAELEASRIHGGRGKKDESH
jgi:hypothetical protein